MDQLPDLFLAPAGARGEPVQPEEKNAGIVKSLHAVDGGDRHTFCGDVIRSLRPVVFRYPVVQKALFIQRLCDEKGQTQDGVVLGGASWRREPRFPQADSLLKPLRKIDARHGKDELAEVVQLPLGDGKAWFYRRHHYRFVMRGAGRPQLTRYRACPVGRRLSDRESPSLLSTVHLEVC